MTEASGSSDLEDFYPQLLYLPVATTFHPSSLHIDMMVEENDLLCPYDEILTFRM